MSEQVDKLSEIKEALANATQGKWEVVDLDPLQIAIGYKYVDGIHAANWIAEIDSDEDNEKQYEDAHLIANAPQWLSYLLSELEQAQAANQKLVECLGWYADTSNQKDQPGYRDFSKYEFDAGQRAVKVLQEVQHGTSSKE